jgi:hypothetical protein
MFNVECSMKAGGRVMTAQSIEHSTLNIQHIQHSTLVSPANRNIRATIRTLLATLLLAGLATGGEGAWMYAKAKLAQILLEMSWRRALAGERVRPWPERADEPWPSVPATSMAQQCPATPGTA